MNDLTRFCLTVGLALGFATALAAEGPSVPFPGGEPKLAPAPQAARPDAMVLSLARYCLGTGDFAGAAALAKGEYASAQTPEARAEAARLLADIERQRALAIRVSLDAARRARAQCDWFRLRREVAGTLAADPENPAALALARWMAECGIIRPFLVGNPGPKEAGPTGTGTPLDRGRR